MHILILVHDLRPGGAERIALRLGSQWARNRETVTVFCGELEGPLRSLVDEKVKLLAADPPVRRAGASRFRLGARAATFVRSDKPDVIFLPGNYYFDAAAALKVRLRGACPLIVGKISNALRRPQKSWAGRSAYYAWFAAKSLFVDHIVAMSPRLLAEARRTVPGPRRKFSTIAQPVLDSPAAAIADGASTPARTRSGPVRLVAAGRLAPQKNFPLLLDAFERLRQTCAATLDVFGEGPLRAELEARIDGLGLTGTVRLRGYAPSLEQHLRDYDLFVLSSDFEGFPSVLVEAFAAGLPVVTTDCSPAVADLMSDDFLGRIVPIRDPDALATAMRELANSPRENPERLQRRAEEFGLSASAGEYLALFDRLLGRRSER